MSMTADDVRDGLALDAHEVALGPFAPMLAPGLCLSLTLQGDVVQQLSARHLPLAEDAGLPLPDRDEVSVAELERLRLARLLRSLGRYLGPPVPGSRALRFLAAAASAEAGKLPDLAGLRRLFLCSGALSGVQPGLGVLPAESARRLGGCVARAAGTEKDLRTDIPAYRRLGFQAISRSGGDVRARVRQWLDEACDSAALAGLDAAKRARLDRSTAASLFAGDAAPESLPEQVRARASTALFRGRAWDELVPICGSFDADVLRALLPETPA